MKALVISQPGKAEIVPVPEPVGIEGSVLLKVRIVGLCGSDLNSFRGRNPLVSFPRIPGHEVAATIVEAETENRETQTFLAAVEEVAFTGRVVYIGYAKERVAYETRWFVQKELDILGSRNALPEDFHAVIRMLEQRRFPVEDAVSQMISLEEAPEALRSWSAEPSRVKKIMVCLD